MQTLTRPAAAGPDPRGPDPRGPDRAARAAWQRRVARIGSLIQLAFATVAITIGLLLLWLRASLRTPAT